MSDTSEIIKAIIYTVPPTIVALGSLWINIKNRKTIKEGVAKVDSLQVQTDGIQDQLMLETLKRGNREGRDEEKAEEKERQENA